MDPEMKARVEDWRRRTAAGEPISLDEMRQAIIYLRGGRKAALEASASSKSGGSRAKKPARNADDMLADFEGGA